MLKQELVRLAKSMFANPISKAPESDFTIAPETQEDAAAVLGFASENKLKVLFWGGGTHQGFGYEVQPDVVMTTVRLNRIVDWQPDDLTVVAQPGVLVSDLESRLNEEGQTAVLPEDPGVATVGGTIAAGVSGWRRLRYGPTRDRSLEVRMATGDGRLVRGGGRLVKNVTGYDLPRLATGSFGSLGLITEVCLKLWPCPERDATVFVEDPAAALALAYRPVAVVEMRERSAVYLSGTAAEIEEQQQRIGGVGSDGHQWPDPLAGDISAVVRVPAGEVGGFVGRLRELDLPFQAAHGVGEIRLTTERDRVDELTALRTRAEAVGGWLVVNGGQTALGLDPWGTAPASLELQRRVKEAFDPLHAANPGRLPGRL